VFARVAVDCGKQGRFTSGAFVVVHGCGDRLDGALKYLLEQSKDYLTDKRRVTNLKIAFAYLGEAARMASRGPMTHDRLSREEYANTISDMLGVRLDVTEPGVMGGLENAVMIISKAGTERWARADKDEVALGLAQRIARDLT
jgi:hypothetical protein